MGRILNSQGILVSRHGRRAIVLTKEGDFRSVKLKRSVNVSVGQIILPKYLSRTHAVYKYIMTPLLVVGFSLLFLLPFTHNTYDPDMPIAAYVNFEMLPSIETGVDQDYRVLSVQALNKDAREVIPDPDRFENMPFDQFSTILFERFEKMGYLNNQSLCLISAAITNRMTRSHRDAFYNGLVHAFSDRSAQLIHRSGSHYEWLRMTMAGRLAAEKNGLSSGKYLLYLRAHMYGKPLTLGQAKQLSVSQIEQLILPVQMRWNPFLIKAVEHEKKNDSGRNLNTDSLFQNPFEAVKQAGHSDKTTSYQFLNRHCRQADFSFYTEQGA
ncbi:anti-sigma factor domain-containing protein [Sporolactobacillus sp. THM7-4]|nr:anti-sigma factor domain-containing protein [Sporolactobacillus sp. THM7-4]